MIQEQIFMLPDSQVEVADFATVEITIVLRTMVACAAPVVRKWILLALLMIFGDAGGE